MVAPRFGAAYCPSDEENKPALAGDTSSNIAKLRMETFPCSNPSQMVVTGLASEPAPKTTKTGAKCSKVGTANCACGAAAP